MLFFICDSLQATVATCDRVTKRKRHGESHGTQALPGGETKKRGETSCRDTDTMEDQIFWKQSRKHCIFGWYFQWLLLFHKLLAPFLHFIFTLLILMEVKSPVNVFEYFFPPFSCSRVMAGCITNHFGKQHPKALPQSPLNPTHDLWTSKVKLGHFTAFCWTKPLVLLLSLTDESLICPLYDP